MLESTGIVNLKRLVECDDLDDLLRVNHRQWVVETPKYGTEKDYMAVACH